MKRNTLFAVAVVAGTVAVGALVVARSKGTGLNRPSRRALLDAAQSAYATTLAALDPAGASEDDIARRDAQANSAAEALRRAFDSSRPSLINGYGQLVGSFVEHVSSAQLQIAAFAINRKNRGLPDSAQIEAEREDREAFRSNATPIFEQLLAALR